MTTENQKCGLHFGDPNDFNFTCDLKKNHDGPCSQDGYTSTQSRIDRGF